MSKKPNESLFKPKYFPGDTGVWDYVSLPQCQELAECLHRGEETFEYLDVAQLLKHALGLATACGKNFRLFYLYYDCAGREMEAHAEEIQRFRAKVGDELRFTHMTYQALFQKLKPHLSTSDSKYGDYMEARYFASQGQSA